MTQNQADKSTLKTKIERARKARARYVQTRRDLAKVSAESRASLEDLHEAGLTWPQVAEEVGMSAKAVAKFVQQPARQTVSAPWWQRMPESLTSSHKLGPGGMDPDKVVTRQEMMGAVKKVLTDHELDARRTGSTRRRATPSMTPADLSVLVAEKLGKEVSTPSLRAALYQHIEEGTIERVGHGRYALVRRPRASVAAKTSR